MDQSFAGKSDSLPKTQSLKVTIDRAIAVAARHAHRVVTLEHLLWALLDDADAAFIFSASQIDVPTLRTSVDDYLTHGLVNLRSPAHAEPFLSNEVEMVIANAGAAAKQTGRHEINGAIVLAAIVGGNATAAQILANNGLTFDAAINAVRARYASSPQFGDTQSSSPYAPEPAKKGWPADQSPTPSLEETTSRGEENVTVDDLMASVKEMIGASTKNIPNPLPEQTPTSPAETTGYHDVMAPTIERPTTAPPAVGVPGSPTTGAPGTTHHESVVENQRARSQSLDQQSPGPEAYQETYDDYAASRRVAEPQMPTPATVQPPVEQPQDYPTSPHTPYDGVVAPAPTPSTMTPSPLPHEQEFVEPQTEALDNTTFDFEGDARYGAAEELARPEFHTDSAYPIEEEMPPQRDIGGLPAPVNPAGTSQLENALHSGTLVENIPREMRVGDVIPVEVRIASSDVADLDRGMTGPLTIHAVGISEAMTVQLRAPQGGFIIESAAPETQWVGKRPDNLPNDHGNWSWTIRPTARGRKRLQLILSARLVDERGLVAETAMPEQVIMINVKVNYVETLKKLASWAAIALAGGVLSHYGETMLRWVSGGGS